MFSALANARIFGLPIRRETASTLTGDRSFHTAQRLSSLPEAREAARDWRFSYEADALSVRLTRNDSFDAGAALCVTRFRIRSANRPLLDLLGRSEPQFNVLEMDAKGLELCWHADLSRAFENRAAVRNEMNIETPTQTLVLDHFVMPQVREGRIIGLEGWFDLMGEAANSIVNWPRVAKVQRSGRGRLVHSVEEGDQAAPRRQFHQNEKLRRAGAF